jgi:hypothetical protein
VRDFPTTAGSFQPDFNGSLEGNAYGKQNGFVAKLSPDGESLVWASYAGVGWLCRDIAVDVDGDVYVNTPYTLRVIINGLTHFTNFSVLN